MPGLGRIQRCLPSCAQTRANRKAKVEPVAVHMFNLCLRLLSASDHCSVQSHLATSYLTYFCSTSVQFKYNLDPRQLIKSEWPRNFLGGRKAGEARARARLPTAS